MTANSFARSKIVTAFQVNTTARWLVIDPSQTTHDRYRQLLGESRVTLLLTGLSGFNTTSCPNSSRCSPNFIYTTRP